MELIMSFFLIAFIPQYSSRYITLTSLLESINMPSRRHTIENYYYEFVSCRTSFDGCRKYADTPRTIQATIGVHISPRRTVGNRSRRNTWI
jgi:hypothetical protein